jgi:flagellar hook protein FlgE
MMQGFYTGVSGIQTHQYGLDVIADNLANVSTTAYKSATTEFADLFSKVVQSGGTPTANDIGYGTRLQATTIQFAQGSVIPSDRFNDLSLEGHGWFGVTSGDNQFFTRDGHFLSDTNEKVAGDNHSSYSNLVTSDGKYVTGTMLNNYAYNATYPYTGAQVVGEDGAFVISTPTRDVPLNGVDAQGKLELPTRLAYPVQPTTQVDFFGNLGNVDEPRAIGSDAVSASDEHNNIRLAFTKSALQPAIGITWDVVATVTSNDGSVVYDTQNGQARFGPSGRLESFDIAAVNNDGTTVAINLGNRLGGVISTDDVGISGSSTSNGVSGGALTNYGIDSNGIIMADFSNGRQSAIGRVAVYHFQNDQGLTREGGTYYQQSSDSGNPLFFTDSSGNATTGATIRSHSLEASNVSLEVGLTEMIIMQRAYQANAKTITTVDEMIQKALQMRR